MFNKIQIWRIISVFIFLSVVLISLNFAQSSKLPPEKSTVIQCVEKLKSAHDEAAIYVWEHPELGFAEFKSSAKLENYLKQNGFEIKKGVAGIETAFIATWGSGQPIIGFLGEYDALPNLSQELGAAEKKPIVDGAPGHGCGHNLFGAASATAAIATAQAMEKHGMKGTVRFYGTPGEEAGGGKVFMAREGLWDDCNAVIAWHPGTSNSVNYGTCLALQNVKIRFYGKSAHTGTGGSITRSALDAIEIFNTGMNFMRNHLENDIRIQYVITSAGQAPNVPPSHADVWYYLRAPHRATVDFMFDWMKRIAEGAALITNTTSEVQIIDGLWEVLPNRTLAKTGDSNISWIGAPAFSAEDEEFGERIAEAMKKTGVTGIEAPYYATKISHPDLSGTFPDVPRGMHSTDCGNVSWIVPVVQFSAATHCNKTVGHTWLQVTQNAMPPALRAGLTVSKWMAATAIDLLKDPKILKAAWEEHKTYLAKTPYYHPIPKDLPVPTFFEMYGSDWKSIPKPPTYVD